MRVVAMGSAEMTNVAAAKVDVVVILLVVEVDVVTGVEVIAVLVV